MPSSSSLLNRLYSAKGQNSVEEAKAAYSEYAMCHCYNPQRLFLYDSHLGKRVWRDVPCGVCYHCRQTKMNSWVTRMYAHLDDFKHVYFVTLTYRGYNQLNSVSRYIMSRFSDCCWHYDNKNSNNRFAWHPCLLVKKHYQDFLKRLRKNTGYNDISYVVSGEYGHDFGRPHYHFIIFTNYELTYEQICKAWSVDLFRSSDGTIKQYCGQKCDINNRRLLYLLGRVDFNDLVINGTLNTTQKVVVDGQSFSADKCFSYVCKYVCKNNDYNSSRVKMSYHSLFKLIKMVHLYNHDILLDDVESFLDSHYIKYNDANIKFIKTKLCYEKIVENAPDGVDYLYRENLSQFRFIYSLGEKIKVDYFPKDIDEFVSVFSPFVEFSRGTAIGSLYAKAHISEFVNGVFKRPQMQVKGFVIPSYFTRKVGEFIYGLRKFSSSVSGFSTTLGNLPIMRDYMSKVLSGEVSFGFISHIESVESVDILLRSKTSCWVEKCLGKTIRYIFVRCEDTDEDIYACGYVFNRSSRHYDLVTAVPLFQFLQRQLYNIDAVIHRHAEQLALTIRSNADFEHCKQLLGEFGLIESQLRADFVDYQTKYLSDKQADYEMLHRYVD